MVDQKNLGGHKQGGTTIPIGPNMLNHHRRNV